MNDLQMTRRDVVPHSPAVPSASEPQVIEIGGSGPNRGHGGLLEYWHVMRRHKGALIVFTVLGGIAAFLTTLSAARIYQSTLTLEIQGLNDDFLGMGNVNPTVDSSSSSYELDIQTQVRILQSKLLLDRTREKVEAQKRTADLQPPDRLGMWRKALRINPPTADALWSQAVGMATGSVRARASGENRIVELSCDSTSAQTAADFCNTLAAEYIQQNLESRWETTERTGEWLTKQLGDLKQKLEKSEDQLQRYARSSGLLFISEEKQNADEAKLIDLQKELSVAQADRISKQSKYEMASNSAPGAVPDVQDDESMKTPQSTLADLEAKLAQLRVAYTDNHAEVKKVKAQIASIESSLQTSRGNIVKRIRNDFEAAKRREALLVTTYAAQAKLVAEQAEEAAHYKLLQREVDASRTMYENLLQKMKEASIASALRANNVRVLDAAEPSGGPYKPDVRGTCTKGLMFGLVLGIAFVMLRERADRTLQDPGDATFYLGVPELGVIPVGQQLELPRSSSARGQLSLRGRNDAPGQRVETVAWRQKTSLLAESFRTTLTSILFSRRTGERPRVLVFTSASPKEGKTTTVCNLGISLAEISQSVLLIDGDMRRPRLHSVFEIDNEQGLSDLLSEKKPLDHVRLNAACAVTAIPGLYVLASGSTRRGASSLLHSPRLAELITLAREKFDAVIIDTPPMVNIADSRVMARLADGLILIVRSGVTTRDAALLARDRFAEDGIPVLGTILNFWNPKITGYGYYQYYYAGYNQYYGDGDGGSNDRHDDGDAPRGKQQGEETAPPRRYATAGPPLQFLTSSEDEAR